MLRLRWISFEFVYEFERPNPLNAPTIIECSNDRARVVIASFVSFQFGCALWVALRSSAALNPAARCELR